jgi:hypothetical protein
MIAGLGCLASTVDMLGTECDKLAYYFSPQCWSQSRRSWQDLCAGISPSIANVVVSAPQTEAGMMVPGVVTPDVIVARTQKDVISQQQAAVETVGINQGTEIGPLSNNPCEASLYALTHSDCWNLPSLPSVNWGIVALVGGIGILGLAALGGGSPRRYGR